MVQYRLYDFYVEDDVVSTETHTATIENGNNEITKSISEHNKEFKIFLFGINEKGVSACIQVLDYKPFFYIKLSKEIDEGVMKRIKNYLIEQLLKNEDSFYDSKSEQEKDLIKNKYRNAVELEHLNQKTLYGFDAGKFYPFVKVSLNSQTLFKKMSNLFYETKKYNNYETDEGFNVRNLKKLVYQGLVMQLYEANIPPLLRYLHIQDISPTGWIEIKKPKLLKTKISICDKEYITTIRNIKPIKEKETKVPFKIMSFDIEASSSHGDFPLAKKDYKKVASEIVDLCKEDNSVILDELKQLLLYGFGFKKEAEDYQYHDEVISDIYLKNPKYFENVEQCKYCIETLIKKEKRKLKNLDDKSRDEKIKILTDVLNRSLPKVQGDTVTFIGSTIMKYGEEKPYLNHCVVLNGCDPVNVENSYIETCEQERDLLMKWRELILEEKPNFIIGYNTFGFDYKFLYDRAEELNILTAFSKFNYLHTSKTESPLEYKKTKLASGDYELYIPNMIGIVQIDLLGYFRREYNLDSYKLDYVSSYFISDKIKSYLCKEENETILKTNNLQGLEVGNYIHIEQITHSSDLYDNGRKFRVLQIDENEKTLTIEGVIDLDMSIVNKWTMAKDDVSPKDIFRLTNGSDADRSIVAKYCIQDCNLVHHLMKKVDVLTSLLEMANICSVPISFLVQRGQGIKLFSFVAKKCREKDTLIPVLEKGNSNESYEGAIVLPPKCGLYLDEPVAVVDYSSLYPSSMISENISHDSKVWTEKFDLNGVSQGREGNLEYDEMPEYKYVDIEYDDFKYIQKGRTTREKVKVGTKICRFAQFKDGKRAIMPDILTELLKARKTTRTRAIYKTVKTKDGEKIEGIMIENNDAIVKIKTETNGIVEIQKEDVENIQDTYDDFMKNVLDKRQLAYKITANSLYGQSGATTSSFYEKDVAASTTATGRKLLTYARRIIEEVYGDTLCKTKYGLVKTKAEYIYGDSVLGDTPIILKKRDTNEIKIKQIKDMFQKWEPYQEFKPFDTYESNRKEKQQSLFTKYEVWTSNGWANIKRVIRHKCNKKIYRVVTHNSVVDVSEDHSLLDNNKKIIKPTECKEGIELLSNKLVIDDYKVCKLQDSEITYKTNLAYKSLFKNSLEKEKVKMVKVLYNKYDDFVYDIETEDGTFNTGFPLIVKNTDSVFMSFKLRNPETDEPIKGKEALKISIDLAKEAGHLATKFLKPPHDLEYEKTFMPFCLLSKKRYVGMLYENDPNKCYRKSMGIVLKRRDNAPIVKDVYGGIIDILMKEQNIKASIDYLKGCLKDIIDSKYPLEKLIITKSLRNDYANPKSIAHKVLADRMGERDPGNKPGPGDRIPFVYIENKTKSKLQGDKVEHPAYIRENNLKPDFGFYITNQIMKPVSQIFGLILNDIPEFSRRKNNFENEKKTIRYTVDDEKKVEDKINKLIEKEVKALLFDPYLRVINNKKQNNQSIMNFFQKKK